MSTPTAEELRQLKELARRLYNAVESHNQRHPRAQIKKEATLTRIYDNDPSIPRTKRSKRDRPTRDPGIFTLKRLAERAGARLIDLIGGESAGLSPASIEQATTALRQLSMAIGLAQEETKPEDNVLQYVPFRPKLEVIEGDEYHFPVPPAAFKQRDFDYPQAWHYLTGDDMTTDEVPAVAASPTGAGGSPRLLYPRGAKDVREVFDRINQIVRVIGDSMEDRYFEGDMLRVDTGNRNPLRGDPIAVYCDDLGGSLVGFFKPDGDRVVLVKKNKPKHSDIVLPPKGWLLLGPVVEIVRRIERRERL